MTPAETYEVIEAANWRENKRWRQRVAIARLTAVLTRAKRVPSLSSLLAQPRKLSGKELRQRRREFKEVASAKNIERINAFMAKRSGKRN